MDLSSQLRTVVFFTGAFLAAWSWVLVYYASCHILAGESPLDEPIGFGGHTNARSLINLVSQYIAVCAIAAFLSSQSNSSSLKCAIPFKAAVEFFPSPVFAGALMAYLVQFDGGVHLLLLNLVTTWVVAAVLSFIPTSGKLGGLGEIVGKTVSFGLGVAWNSLISKIEPLSSHFYLQSLYVALMLLLAVSLSVPELKNDSVRERHASLLSFASRVVCAFALSDWLSIVMPSGLIGSIYSLASLLVLAAVFSVLVIHADIERSADLVSRNAPKESVLHRIIRCLVIIPCIWCCCPCVPLFWLLSAAGVGVKDRWLRMIADVTSLAASVVGTGILTGVLDSFAISIGICSESKCNTIAFLVYASVAALVVSVSLIAAITPLSPSSGPAISQDPLLENC